MNKVLAVALLDGRRLGFGLLSTALVAGLIPSLANGLGAPVPAASVLAWTFLVVGAACGGYFGNDFADGRSSFFFARPLPTSALIAGRVVALLALTSVAFLAFMASNWLSSTDHEWTFRVLDKRHPRVLIFAWAVSLFVTLGIAARARDTRGQRGFRELVRIPVRLGAMLGAFLLMFGLFADLILRAYMDALQPIEIFLWSWLIASLVASVVAIAAGRTERLRIARFQSMVMVSHFILVSVVVVAAWSYVLHPEADAIEEVGYPIWDAGDGRTAYVTTIVNRGNRKSFQPVFGVDIPSGRVQRLNADKYMGPWTSSDGATLVWSEATPFFFRPLRRYMGGETTFRVRNRAGETALPMPVKAPDFRTARDLSRFGGVFSWVLPAPDGDVFAIHWDRHLTFTSRTRGELADLDFGGARPTTFRAGLFLPSGDLRAAVIRNALGGGRSLVFVDIDPRTGAQKELHSLTATNVAAVQFDSTGARAFVSTLTTPGRGGDVLLMLLDGRTGPVTRMLVAGKLFPTATFMGDGRIVASSRPLGDAPGGSALAVFSPEGEPLREILLKDALFPRPLGEMFPGVLAVSDAAERGTRLIDLNTGNLVRELPGLRHHASYFRPPPPGSAAARLLVSRDHKLYELASIDAQPRLLLPLGRD